MKISKILDQVSACGSEGDGSIVVLLLMCVAALLMSPLYLAKRYIDAKITSLEREKHAASEKLDSLAVEVRPNATIIFAPSSGHTNSQVTNTKCVS